MKRLLRAGLVVFGLTMAFSAMAEDHPDACQYLDVYGIRGGGGGGGGEFPSPFVCATVGPKFELASGEIYILIGRVYIQGGFAFLYIDYKAHPWLKNQERRTSPYYILYGVLPDTLKDFHNRIVRVRVQAMGQVARNMKGVNTYYLGLRPLETPRLVK